MWRRTKWWDRGASQPSLIKAKTALTSQSDWQYKPGHLIQAMVVHKKMEMWSHAVAFWMVRRTSTQLKSNKMQIASQIKEPLWRLGGVLDLTADLHVRVVSYSIAWCTCWESAISGCKFSPMSSNSRLVWEGGPILVLGNCNSIWCSFFRDNKLGPCAWDTPRLKPRASHPCPRSSLFFRLVPFDEMHTTNSRALQVENKQQNCGRVTATVFIFWISQSIAFIVGSAGPRFSINKFILHVNHVVLFSVIILNPQVLGVSHVLEIDLCARISHFRFCAEGSTTIHHFSS